jgi:glycerol-3-phosphate dehydrogenase
MNKLTSLSVINRESQLKLIENKTFDLLIIGGGITGAGIALDAALRGMEVCLIEKSDFASGTSSRSTKLIHGGLRYLKQLDIKLVRDSGTERAIAHKNAPHLVIPEKMLLPIVENGSLGKTMTSIGLVIYDWLAKVKKSERRKMLSKEQTIELAPQLRKDILKGGGYYTEYRTDDARLTIEVIKTAAQNGALCLNYFEGLDFIYENNKVVGIKAKDLIHNKEINIKAKQVVSATGPWSDILRKKDKSLNNKKLHLTKGVHIVIPKEVFSLNDTIYFDVPGGRMIFAIPRGNVTYIGTTDTNYKRELEEPTVAKSDVDYLLDAVNNMFPEANLKQENIISSWAGLRPLIHEKGKSPSELSRKDEIFKSNTGLITIAGGKLTGYRLMAKKVVDLVSKRLNIYEKCTTKEVTLSGGDINTKGEGFYIQKLVSKLIPELEIEREKATKIISDLYFKYGSNTEIILDKVIGFKENKLLKAEVWYVVHHESVNSLHDYFIRRSGKLLFAPQVINSELEIVAKEFKIYFNWTDEKLNHEIKIIKKWQERIIDFK